MFGSDWHGYKIGSGCCTQLRHTASLALHDMCAICRRGFFGHFKSRVQQAAGQVCQVAAKPQVQLAAAALAAGAILVMRKSRA